MKTFATLAIACFAGLAITSCSTGTLDVSVVCGPPYDFSWTLTNDTADVVIIDNVVLSPAATSESATRWIGKPLYQHRSLAAGSTESFHGQTITITSHPQGNPGSPSVQELHTECDV